MSAQNLYDTHTAYQTNHGMPATKGDELSTKDQSDINSALHMVHYRLEFDA